MKTKPKFNRNYKIKQFKLSEEEKELMGASEVSLKSIVITGLEKQINSLKSRLEEMKNEESKSTKKNIILKLKKFKNELNDDNAIKKRVNMLKIKRRKLKSLNSKIEVKLDKIKLQKVRCFKCKRRGHTVSDCKFQDVVTEESSDKNISEEKKVMCYNCGASDHNLYSCSTKVNYSDLPFADCFICNKKGHLSSKCPQNDKGIYIRGGSCFICNGKDHLAKNCPQKQIEVAQVKPNKILTKKPATKSNKKFNKIKSS
jgi:zinc finger CCHC domain-containing protein 9